MLIFSNRTFHLSFCLDKYQVRKAGQLLSVLRGHSGFFIATTTANVTSDFEGFSISDLYALHLFSYLNS